ncbi:MAG: tetratricopeptide repeat protein [Candidatus Hydrogenedens sp.]|jgi:tetratricopeptide (TPR) repeat protein|nr:tetratricopeptide repeat protein [Candidatus Hydrogenedens sp.]
MTTTLILILMGIFPAAPDEAAALMAEAAHSYQQGNYKEAIDLYERVRKEHDRNNPAVLYNIASAWHQEGAPGMAILYYEGALMLDPGFGPARENLALALEQSRRNLPLPDSRNLQSPVLRYVPLTARQGLWLTHTLIFLSLLFMLLFHWKKLRRYFWLTLSAALLAVMFFVWTVAASQASKTLPRLAVACSEEVPVYFSTRESDQPRFMLYEGDRVLVDRNEGEWLRVCVQGGEKGWAKRELVYSVESVFQ